MATAKKRPGTPRNQDSSCLPLPEDDRSRFEIEVDNIEAENAPTITPQHSPNEKKP